MKSFKFSELPGLKQSDNKIYQCSCGLGFIMNEEYCSDNEIDAYKNSILTCSHMAKEMKVMIREQKDEIDIIKLRTIRLNSSYFALEKSFTDVKKLIDKKKYPEAKKEANWCLEYLIKQRDNNAT